MTKNTHASTASIYKKRRTYSVEFKHSIVQACKESNTSIASVALQYGLNANLVSEWIRRLDKPSDMIRHFPPSLRLLLYLTLQHAIHPLQQFYFFRLLCLIRAQRFG